MSLDLLKIGKHTFNSRLILGTGKYSSPEIMKMALEASGTEFVTVAVRRVDFSNPNDPVMSALDLKKYKLLPNTAACFTADEAIRTAQLGRELCGTELVKLEVIGDKETLYPDLDELLKATKQLVKDGFVVMAYTTDDLIYALKLQDAGAACVMPLGAPIGSGLGILNQLNIKIICRRLSVPVIVDAGVGTASDVAVAMELGAGGILLNTGVALAKDPVKMAEAVKLACISGRLACLSGRMPKREYASPSSPDVGKINS
ncbi:MAG: thiazole synthase [Planctomycetes bacterium]|nr:thiazole synthase [Planctomycetota bacterium]